VQPPVFYEFWFCLGTLHKSSLPKVYYYKESTTTLFKLHIQLSWDVLQQNWIICIFLKVCILGRHLLINFLTLAAALSLDSCIIRWENDHFNISKHHLMVNIDSLLLFSKQFIDLFAHIGSFVLNWNLEIRTLEVNLFVVCLFVCWCNKGCQQGNLLCAMSF